MNNWCRVGVLALTLPFLNGCITGAIVAQVVPAMLGGVAIANADDRSPFRIDKSNMKPHKDNDLVELDEQIRQAECGDPQSQFWLASALKSGFNTTPNMIEVYKWYRLAEIGEYAPATAERVALDASMSKPELAEARDRVQAWQATTEGCTVSS